MTTLSYRVTSKSLRYREPLASEPSFQDRTSFLVTLTTASNRACGEAAPLPGWTESTEACRNFLETIEPQSLTDLRQIEEAHTDHPAGRHALNQARLDLICRLENQPLYEAFTPDQNRTRSLQVNALVRLRNPQWMAKLKRYVKQGYRTVKIKTNRSPAETLKQFRKLTEQLPASVKLRVDPNGQWCLSNLKSVLDGFTQLNLEYFEQPFGPDQLHDLTELNKEAPVALDESVLEHGLTVIDQTDAADYVVLKPMALGGLKLSETLIERSLDKNLTPIVTATFEGIIGRLAASHLAGAWSHHLPACGLCTSSPLLNDSSWDEQCLDEGKIELPDSPGLGLPEDEIEGYN